MSALDEKANHRALRLEIEDVVFLNPGRDDQDRLQKHLVRRRLVLDQLDQVVAIDDLAGRDRHVASDLERFRPQVLRDCETLIADYGGRPSRLHDSSRDARDLEQKLLAFYGVGPVTVNIFLRELRPVWAKADPDPLPAVERLAERLSVDLSCYRRKSMVFARVEAGLIRRRRELVAA